MNTIKHSRNVLLALLYLVFIQEINSQNIAINRYGNSPFTGTILDLSNQGTADSLGFLPPYVSLTSAYTLAPPITGGTSSQLSGLIVYNTNSSTANGLNGVGLYYWYDPYSCWVYFGNTAASVAGGGTSNYLSRWITATTLGTGVAQDNGTGVAISASAMTPLSMLDVNGAMAVGTYAGTATAPASGMIVSGQMGIGNNAPNANAILDLTNASGKGLLLPPMLTANLPSPITAAQNGLLVFNNTIGCPLYADASKWMNPQRNVTGTTTTITFNAAPADTIYEWTVPPCVTTLTIVAAGGAGGTETTAPYSGGDGAVITEVFTVNSGQVLDILAGAKGADNGCGAGGGGGGSFVWIPGGVVLIAAGGGGGGGGHGAAGVARHEGRPGSTTVTPTSIAGYDGAAGTWTGNPYTCTGGAQGGGGNAAGGGGAGFGDGFVQFTGTGTNFGSNGSGYGGAFVGGIGSIDANNNCGADPNYPYGGTGGYGGGGGAGNYAASGYGGGGGGGGITGGGGGNGSATSNNDGGGGGGGSVFWNTGTGAYNNPPGAGTATQTNTTDGYVIIKY
jgi:hypothetical protein